MEERPPPLSPQRFMFAWNLLQAKRAERRGDFSGALRLVEEASKIMPLDASDRVYRAMLLLRSQRTREAHNEFAALRSAFKGSNDPNLRYLRHYCTHMLSLMVPGSSQWSYEANEAKLINCSRSIKWRFPMTSADDIHERIRPRS